MILLQHVKAVVSGKIIENAQIVIDGKKIVDVENGSRLISATKDSLILDGQGAFVSAGWIDLQINGGFGIDFTFQPERLWDVAAQLPRLGTTSFLPTVITSPFETYERALKILMDGSSARWRGALPLGYHFEGPFINAMKKGAHNSDFIRKPNLPEIAGWSKENGVRLVTLAPEMQGAKEMISALQQMGVVVSAGHSMADFEQAAAGFEMGIRMGTHLYNAMPPLAHRDPGLSGALLTHKEVYAGLIADGVHSHPAMVSLAWKSKGAERLILVTDAMAALGMLPGRYQLGGYAVIVDDKTAKLENGTLAGSILTQGQSLVNLMQYAGCSLEEAVLCLTRNPAQCLGLSEKGDIFSGADADLTMFTGDGTVTATIIDGHVVYSAL